MLSTAPPIVRKFGSGISIVGVSKPPHTLCDRCLTRNALGAHFCRQCDAPLTTHAVNDPLGQIKVEGDFVRNLKTARKSRIVKIGTILLFGPTFLASLLVLLIIPYKMITEDNFAGPGGRFRDYVAAIFAVILSFGVMGFLLFYSGKVLWLTLRNQLTQSRE